MSNISSISTNTNSLLIQQIQNSSRNEEGREVVDNPREDAAEGKSVGLGNNINITA